MTEAFNILKVKVGTEFVVKEARWRRLVKVVAPDISSSHLLRISDEGQKGHVGKKPQWEVGGLGFFFIFIFKKAMYLFD